MGQEITTAQEAIKIIESTLCSDGLKFRFTPSQIQKIIKLKAVQKNKIMIQPKGHLKELALDIFLQLRNITPDVHYKIIKVQDKQLISFEFKNLVESQVQKINKIFQLKEIEKLGVKDVPANVT